MRAVIIPLMVVLTCSCHEAMPNSQHMRARKEFSKAMKKFYSQDNSFAIVGQYAWSFRGPLATPSQVEADIVGQGNNDEAFQAYPGWIGLKNRYQEGDQFYSYLKTYVHDAHWSEGYVLTRNREVLGWVVTLGN